MKLILTCLTAVTFSLKSLKRMFRGMARKFWNGSGAQRRSSCVNLWQTCAWQGVSTLCIMNTKIRVATVSDILQGTPSVKSLQYLFN